MFQPSERFRAIHGEGVSPGQARRILTSILYNHDSVADLVTTACQLSKSMGRALTFAEAAEIAADEGAAFDADGWLAARVTG